MHTCWVDTCLTVHLFTVTMFTLTLVVPNTFYCTRAHIGRPRNVQMFPENVSTKSRVVLYKFWFNDYPYRNVWQCTPFYCTRVHSDTCRTVQFFCTRVHLESCRTVQIIIFHESRLTRVVPYTYYCTRVQISGWLTEKVFNFILSTMARSVHVFMSARIVLFNL